LLYHHRVSIDFICSTAFFNWTYIFNQSFQEFFQCNTLLNARTSRRKEKEVFFLLFHYDNKYYLAVWVGFVVAHVIIYILLWQNYHYIIVIVVLLQLFSTKQQCPRLSSQGCALLPSPNHEPSQ